MRVIATILIGMAIFIGLPLLGWGIDDFRGFIGQPARLTYLVLVFLMNAIIAIRIPEVGHDRSKGVKMIRRQKLAVLLLQIINLSLVIVAPYGDRRDLAVFGDHEIIRYFGLVLYLLGIIGMHWAEMALGKQFNIQVSIIEGHRLLTDGPYKYLRHPRYSSIIIFITGISLVFRSWLALILAAATALVLLWRIHDEEKLMSQQFGDEWQSYIRKTWRLIPFIY